MLDIIFTILCISIGLVIVRQSSKSYGTEVGKQVYWMYLVHMLITVIYIYITTADKGNDSLRYWSTSRLIDSDMAVGFLFSGRSTNFIFGFVFLFSSILDLSYITCTLIFSTLGFISIRLFLLIAHKVVPYNSKIFNINLFPMLFLLPNLHFWSVGIGKDTLILLAVSLVFYFVLRPKKRILLLVIGVIIFVLVRPHVLLMLSVGLVISILFQRNMSKLYKGSMIIVFVIVGIILLPKVKQIANLDEISVENYTNFATNKAEALSKQHTGSSVDINSYPFFLKILTFLYRPTFIDIDSAPALVAAIENLLLLILSIRVLFNKPIETYRKAPLIIKIMLWYSIIAATLFSMSLGNLGIMLRMRNMILPCLIIYILWCLSYILALKKKSFNVLKLKVDEI